MYVKFTSIKNYKQILNSTDIYVEDSATHLKFLKKQDRMLDRYVISQYNKMDQWLLSNSILISTIYPPTRLWARYDLYALVFSLQHMTQRCWFNTYVLTDPMTK